MNFLSFQDKRTRVLLLAIFIASVALKIFFVFATPLYMDEAGGKIHPLNDEYPHLKYSLYLIEHHELPVNKRNYNLENPAAWIFLDFEYGQAPLYYVLNIPFASMPNPMVMSRLFSVLLSTITLWIAVACFNRIFPKNKTAAVAAAALLALNPVLLRIGSSVSNDNLLWLISMILSWLLLEDPKLEKKWLWGLLIGCGVLTKVSFLIWPLFLLLRILFFQREKEMFVRYAKAGCISVVIFGWWLIRSHSIYGDWTGIAGGAGTPGDYLRSGSIYLLQDFADSVLRFTFFPIAEETPKFLRIPQIFALVILASCFLQFNKLRESFSDRNAFRDFWIFNAVNFAAFLYPNLVWPYADGRLLFIGLLPMAAIAVAALCENFGRFALVAAMILNATYLAAIC